MFANPEIDIEIEGAFTGARDILQMFSVQSAQAAHYFEITTLLSDAVTEKRQKLNAQKTRGRNRYVGRIFNLDVHDVTKQPEQSADGLSTLSAEGNGGVEHWLQNAESMVPQMGQHDLRYEDFLGWDSLNLGLWDSFPFTTETILPTG